MYFRFKWGKRDFIHLDPAINHLFICIIKSLLWEMRILSDRFTKIKNKCIFKQLDSYCQFYELEYISSIFLYCLIIHHQKIQNDTTCPRNDLESRVLSSLRLISKSIITHDDSQRDEKTSILQEPSIDWVGLTGRMNMNPSGFLADPHLCEWVQDQELIKIWVRSLSGSLWSCSHQTPYLINTASARETELETNGLSHCL